MGNLFIGFPVPRAKIATMIEEAAPPLEHVANHEPDGTDPIVLPGDISTDEVLQWNGTKFIGAAAGGNGGVPSPISINSCAFIPVSDTEDYSLDGDILKRRTGTTLLDCNANVCLPHGVTITKLTLYAYRNDADASIQIVLYRVDPAGTINTLASVSADWTSGNSSKFDDTVSNATIDNTTYSYQIYCGMDPNDSVNDVKLSRVQIDFT